MKAVHWGTDDNPGEVMLLLADGPKTWGYGYGPGWSMIFGSAHGEVQVEVGQWVVRHDNGRIEVLDEKPEGAEIFDAVAAREALTALREKLQS